MLAAERRELGRPATQMNQFRIHLIGPGGAGKSTVGRVLAERLTVPFVDLDRAFVQRLGDISVYIDRDGYESYARENVETYRQLLPSCETSCVLALSSGFMTYPEAVHPEYKHLRQEIEAIEGTFLLLPSFELDDCVREIVRRQLTRPFARSLAAEEAVIRRRFAIYAALKARKVETMRSPVETAEDIMLNLPSNIEMEPTLPTDPYTHVATKRGSFAVSSR